jgi:NADH-quinone oxidoreductase subunit N
MFLDYLELFRNGFKLFIPDAFLGFSLLLLLIVGVFIKTEENEALSLKNINWLSLEVLGLMILLMMNHPYYSGIILNGMIFINYFTLIIKIIIILSCGIVLLMGFQYYEYEKLNSFEFSILILLAALGMSLLASSYDFMMVYLAIELQSLSFYILASFKRDSQFSTEAGLKYFILGALSSGILLFGCSLIYGLTGSTNFESLNHLLMNSVFQFNELNTGISVAITFIIVALLFKLAAAPFHMWAPDVYEGAPTIVTAFFAIVPKIAVLTLLIQLLLESFYGLISQWQQLLIFSSMTSMILGAVGAIEQKKIKRFLAYSAIGHVGYLLIGLSCGTLEGLQSVIIYIIIYMIMSINVFCIILSLYKKTDSTRIIYINEFTGLSKENPLLAITFSVMVLSMAGIPPLAGFISKLQIFYSAIASSLILLAIIGVLTSVLGAVYYIRFVKIIYFENYNSFIYKELDLTKSIIISITFLSIIFFLFNPSYILILSHDLSLNLSL